MHLFYIIFYIYGSIYRRNIRHKYNLTGLVQDHHIIPREFKHIYTKIDESKNIIMLPTIYSKEILNTKRSIHYNGHPKYNKLVKKLLENYSPEEIIIFLKQELRKGNPERLL